MVYNCFLIFSEPKLPNYFFPFDNSRQPKFVVFPHLVVWNILYEPPKSLEILLPISLEQDPALPAFLDSFQWQQPTLKHLDIQWAVDISNSTSPTAAFHLLEKAFETVFQSLSKSRLKLTHLVYDVFPLSKMASCVFSEYLSRHGASIEVCQLTTPRFGDLSGTDAGDNEEEDRVKKARDEILREFLVSLVLHSPKISCYRLSWVGKEQVGSKVDD